MEPNRPHSISRNSSNNNELFLCFTSRLSSSSMKISKSILISQPRQIEDVGAGQGRRADNASDSTTNRRFTGERGGGRPLDPPLAWINHDGFMQVVSDAWAGKLHKSPIVNLALKIKRVRAALKHWNWNKFGDVRVKLKETTKRLEELEAKIQLAWSDDTNKEIIDTKGEISALLRYNFSILEEKARIGWLRDGDRNSGFFHAAIKARRSQNGIRLRLEDDSFTDDVDYIY